VVVGILTVKSWLWGQQFGLACWPSRKSDRYGSRQGGRHPTWLRRRSAASTIWQFAHPAAMVLLDPSFSEGLQAVGEQKISGMITKGFSQQGNRRPVDIELSTT
jgi:hypothetical protein